MPEPTAFVGADPSSTAPAAAIQWTATGGTFRVATVDGICLFRLTGEISTEMAVLKTHLDACISTMNPRIIVNIEDAVLTSPGLSALVETHNRARQAGGQVILCNLSPEARTTLAICKFEQLLRIVDDEPAAFRKLQPT